jgi:VanZ family protein
MPDSLRRALKNPRIWQLILAGYWLALFVATHLPNDMPILPSGRSDKLVHFAAYAILAVLLATTWQLTAGHLTARHLVVLWIAIVLYGAIDEWTQIPVGRDCNLWDWTADAVGALTALAIFARLTRKASTR